MDVDGIVGTEARFFGTDLSVTVFADGEIVGAEKLEVGEAPWP